MLKYALFGFLNYAPMTGYELEHFINVSTGNFWQAKLSQIYTTLKKLEENGAVTSQIEPQEGRPDRRVYTLTDEGRADLLEWLAQPIVKETASKKDELLLKLFFARPAGKNAILTLLRVQRNLHQRELERYTREAPAAITQMVAQNPQLSADAVLWEATRRFGVLYEEMYLRWIDETLALIEGLSDE
jgi:PadR family transcriptional regulator AphA